MSLLADLRSRPALRKTQIAHDASTPSLISTLEISNKYDHTVIQANIENWAEILAPFTPKTLFVPLSVDLAKLLCKIYEFSEKHPELVQAAAVTYVQNGSISNPLLPEEETLMSRLGPQIESAMKQLPGDGCFMKLSSRSSKDAAALSGVFELYYRKAVLDESGKLRPLTENQKLLVLCQAEGNSLHFKDARSIIRSLILSERVWQDLTLAFRHVDTWNMNIVLRHWEPVPIDLEFRTFISNGHMTAVSQYAYQLFSPRLNDPLQLSHALKAIQTSFSSMKDILVSNAFNNYVLDFGVIPPQEGKDTWRATLIEMNPFEESTDAALFSWNEERDLLEGKMSNLEYPVVRFTQKARAGALVMVPKGWKQVIDRVEKGT